MKSTKGQWLFTLLFCLLGFANSNVIMAQGELSNDEIDAYVDYLLCDYNVSISEADLEAALDSIIVTEDIACDPIEVELTAKTATTATFEWAPTATAIDYTVASIGLTDGVVFTDVTPSKEYTFNGLTPQEYIFIFISNCINGSSIADVVIIDMDVYYPDFSLSLLNSCICKRGTPDFLPDAPCPFYMPQITYSWDNGTAQNGTPCQGVKYNFKVTDLEDSSYEEDIWIFNHTTTEVNLEALTCSDLILEENGIEGFMISDPGNFDVILTSESVHFYLTNTSIEIDAMKCGCYTGIIVPRLEAPIEEASLAISPNPFKDNITLTANTTAAGEALISLLSIDGNLLSSEKINVQKGKQSLEISTAHLPAGIYTLLFESNNEQFIERIVKI